MAIDDTSTAMTTLVQALLAGRELDDETAERLAAADRSEMERVLSTWLPDDEVARVLARIDALTLAVRSRG
jgi:hypothetical protein